MMPQVPNQLSSTRRHALNYAPTDSCWWTSRKACDLNFLELRAYWKIIVNIWIDVIAFVVMSRDKRIYRFVLDTRFGRKILLESPHVPDIVEAVTHYVAGQLIERERALAGASDYFGREWRGQPRRGRGLAVFLLGVVVGIAALAAAAWYSANP